VQVTEVSLANLSFSSPDELDSPTSEELDRATSEELDSGTTDELSGSALELVPVTSEEDSGSGVLSGPWEFESPPQLAQKRPATVRQLKRKNLRIFMIFSFSL
jgi:hypothetical protein